MGRIWTTEQAASLAPDASALKAAQGLGTPRKWTLLGRDEDFAWGLAQGSGAQPYQVQIDLSEPAFKCSCPSRKFPCKHGLGLLLVLAANPSALATGARPDWVLEWVAKRAEKAMRAEAKAAAPVAAPDPASQAKRREKREAAIAQGLEFLDGWLRDLARQGLSSAASEGYARWDEAARRLIDAQAPGLARRVRGLGGFVLGVGNGEERAGAELGRLHLLVAASRRRGSLPAEWQAEIDAQLGWTVEQDELRQQAGRQGAWFVGAQTMREDDKVLTRTTYLFGGDGVIAQLLEFSPASHPAVSSYALGRWLVGELVFYPGVCPRRALWKTPPVDAAPVNLQFLARCEEVLSAHAQTCAANPWLESTPVLAELTPQRDAAGWWLRDTAGEALPVAESFALGWELLACAGGKPLRLAGLWDGFRFTPLSAIPPEGLLNLAPRNS